MGRVYFCGGKSLYETKSTKNPLVVYPQVNVADFSNLENIKQQVSGVNPNNIDLGGGVVR